METLEALAVRIEAAAGPDREIDELIADALFERSDFFQLKDAQIGSGCMMWWQGGHQQSALRYTASLDAAMTLVRPDTDVGMHRYQNDKGNGRRFTANITHWPEPPIPLPLTTIWRGQGNSFALALTAAALRAHLLAQKEHTPS